MRSVAAGALLTLVGLAASAAGVEQDHSTATREELARIAAWLDERGIEFRMTLPQIIAGAGEEQGRMAQPGDGWRGERGWETEDWSVKDE